MGVSTERAIRELAPTAPLRILAPLPVLPSSWYNNIRRYDTQQFRAFAYEVWRRLLKLAGGAKPTTINVQLEMTPNFDFTIRPARDELHRACDCLQNRIYGISEYQYIAVMKTEIR
jgi:hypothetical protein